MKTIIIRVIEFLSAAMIIGLPFYAPWVYYLCTGKYMVFGG